MKRIILALSLSCALAGCGGGDSVDGKIAVAGQKVLDRMMPGEFTSLRIREGDRNERCQATVTKAHWTDWDTSDGTLAAHGPRDWSDTMTLRAEKKDGHWVISNSDADPERMAAAEFETHVSECLDSFRTQLARELKWQKERDAETAHNLKSWKNAEASGVTAPIPQVDIRS